MPCILTIPTAIPLHCLELHFTLPFSYLLRETPASVLQSGPGPKRLVTAFLRTAWLNSSSSQAGRRQRLTLHRHEFRWVWNKPRVDLCRAKFIQQKASSRSEKAWDSGVHGPVSSLCHCSQSHFCLFGSTNDIPRERLSLPRSVPCAAFAPLPAFRVKFSLSCNMCFI